MTIHPSQDSQRTRRESMVETHAPHITTSTPAELGVPPQAELQTRTANPDAPRTARPRPIVLGIDKSEYSELALQTVVDMVRNQVVKQEVFLIHVRAPFPAHSVMSFGYVSGADVPKMIAQMEEGERSDSHKLLKKYAARIRDTGAPYQAISMRGEPREELLRKAKEVNADLVVVGSRGLGGFKRALLGSVSSHLMHHAPCSVLVVREHQGSAAVEE